MLRFTLRQLGISSLWAIRLSAVASEKVNVSSPSISAAISQLEDEFGCRFLRANAPSLSLTLAGRQMMKQAKRVLSKPTNSFDLAGDVSIKYRAPWQLGAC